MHYSTVLEALREAKLAEEKGEVDPKKPKPPFVPPKLIPMWDESVDWLSENKKTPMGFRVEIDHRGRDLLGLYKKTPEDKLPPEIREFRKAKSRMTLPLQHQEAIEIERRMEARMLAADTITKPFEAFGINYYGSAPDNPDLPNLKKILWKKAEDKEIFLHDCIGEDHRIEAEIIPTVSVLDNKVESIIICSPDRARSFIEMESTWDNDKSREDMKNHKCNRGLHNKIGKFMLGYLKPERMNVRCMFVNNQDFVDIWKENCFVYYAKMYLIDYAVIRQVPIDYMRVLRPSELMSPFGLRCMLYDENWKALNLEQFDASEFRHFCTSNRHTVIVKDVTYDSCEIPTAHIRVLPSVALCKF